MSTHFPGDECPWVPESQQNHTKDLPGNGVVYKSNVKGLWGQFPPVVPLTENDYPFLPQVKSLLLGCQPWKLRQSMGTERNSERVLITRHTIASSLMDVNDQ